MSQWTHIAGLIRYDAIRTMPIIPPSQFEPTIFLANVKPPTGSEGPLQWDVNETPMQAALAAYAVSFWGDLRDFGSPEDVMEVVDYFQAIVKGRAVRQGCFTIEVEYGPTTTYTYQDGAGFVLVGCRDYESEETEPL